MPLASSERSVKTLSVTNKSLCKLWPRPPRESFKPCVIAGIFCRTHQGYRSEFPQVTYSQRNVGWLVGYQTFPSRAEIINSEAGAHQTRGSIGSIFTQQNTSAVMPHRCFHSLPSAARSSLSSLIGCLIYRKLDQTCRNLSGGLSSWITFFMSSAECNQRVWKALTRMQRSFIWWAVAGYGRIFTRWNRVFHQENWKSGLSQENKFHFRTMFPLRQLQRQTARQSLSWN